MFILQYNRASRQIGSTQIVAIHNTYSTLLYSNMLQFVLGLFVFVLFRFIWNSYFNNTNKNLSLKIGSMVVINYFVKFQFSCNFSHLDVLCSFLIYVYFYQYIYYQNIVRIQDICLVYFLGMQLDFLFMYKLVPNAIHSTLSLHFETSWQVLPNKNTISYQKYKITIIYCNNDNNISCVQLLYYVCVRVVCL
eukprot:TRINITY_DN3995_c2_g1_i3.p2 TRINITY_DN3995_c2_g1~~TRINITY_DN3995_c2_g1_i3.p2  ORF type:complete len:192 (-),score=-38.02 TRINITY_DN3995_c2_g1_i3:644-1219(-)